MNLSNNYPAGCNESTINRHFGSSFNTWFEEHEDWLLDRFIDWYDGVVIIPAVKDWTPETLRLWNSFVEEEYNNYPEYEE